MDMLQIIALAGGLALFLCGMNMMGEGLQKASGSQLTVILEKLTRNPIKAVLFGTGITAIIQSSSATTVMVVGFVNSRLMDLQQAVGVIMGANIGTTVTSWILSLTGIQGDSLLLQLMNPKAFGPILGIIGIVLVMFFHQEKKRQIGSIFLGFAILMYGMETMSTAVAPLAENPQFMQLMVRFSNPLLGVIIGAVLTAIIQSSSASVGILQAFCLTGSISYATALPIIMGQNIGTCITAILASIGTSRNSKRAACIHLSFNVIGTILFMSVFYFINALSPFTFLKESASVAGIAVIHSCFNVAVTLVLLPFSKQLVELARLLLPEDASEKQAACQRNHATGETNIEHTLMEDADRFIDQRFLANPGLAMNQSCRSMDSMTREQKQMIRYVKDNFWNMNKSSYRLLQDMLQIMGEQENRLRSYIRKISQQELSKEESLQLQRLNLGINQLIERQNQIDSLSKAARKMYKNNEQFSREGRKEIDILLSDVCDGTFHGDVSEIRKRHFKRMERGKCTQKLGLRFFEILDCCVGMAK